MQLTKQQKKQIPLQKFKNRYKEIPKVRVQYVRNHKDLQISASQEVQQKIYDATIVCNEPESENVEYLEDSKQAASGDTRIGKHSNYHVDNFYPNAVLCLISLYKSKYMAMKGKSEHQIKSMPLWEDIAHEMNESYFKFSQEQVQQKYAQLREKYFALENAVDIEVFEYFDPMHELYQDKRIDTIAVGGSDSIRNVKECAGYNYDDEILFSSVQSHCVPLEKVAEKDTNEIILTEHQHFHTPEQEVTLETHREIMHKEHEFLDMIEKGFDTNPNQHFAQENDDLAGNGEVKETTLESVASPLQGDDMIVHEDINSYVMHSIRTIKRENVESSELETSSKPKRCKDNLHQKTSPQVYNSRILASTPPQHTNGRAPYQQYTSRTDFTLFDYNELQERRHQEKIELLRKSVLLQERLILQNSHLIDALLKRV